MPVTLRGNTFTTFTSSTQTAIFTSSSSKIICIESAPHLSECRLKTNCGSICVIDKETGEEVHNISAPVALTPVTAGMSGMDVDAEGYNAAATGL
jgi:hypothetical protein